MYNSVNIANRIKKVAKNKNIAIKKMLEDCGLSKNTLSSMLSGGSIPKSGNLAKIADVLDCSVDYLLGRTNIPEINKSIEIIDNRESSNAQIAAYSGKEAKVFHTIDEEIEIVRRI